jgi:hypothetical protein
LYNNTPRKAIVNAASNIVLLRDVFHIGLVIGPRPAVLALQLSKCLADSDLVVIGLTGIGPIRKISVLDWFLPYWPNESFFYCIDRFDHIKADKSKLINNITYRPLIEADDTGR